MRSIKRRVSNQQSQLNEKLLSILQICEKMNAERDLPALLNLLARETARLMEADRQAFPNSEKRELCVYSGRAKVL